MLSTGHETHKGRPMKEQINVKIESNLLERLRNISYATGVGIAFIVENATAEQVKAMEQAYEASKGHPVPKRPMGSDDEAFKKLMEGKKKPR